MQFEMMPKTSFTKSEGIIAEGEKYIAGGVVSLNRKTDPHIVFQRALGSQIFDVDGNEYIDYHAAFSPYLLGHNHPAVNQAAIQSMNDQWSLFGSGTNQLEVALCKKLCGIIPSADTVQITNTGSEATAHAIRLSRAWTDRDHVILVLGGYNGWHNEVARAVMPGLAEIGKRISPGEYPFIPLSAGIPDSTIGNLHVVNFNDLDSVEFVMKKHPVASIIVEPVLQNVGVVLPKAGYLQGLVDLCDQYGALCIFDEVKTGFRSALGGYQAVADVKPHISVFGKAISNGFPLGAIGGRKDIMGLFDHPDPSKRVLIAGTYNAHPVNAAAALQTIEILSDLGVYEKLESLTNLLINGISDLLKSKGIPFVICKNASAYSLYFCEKAPKDWHDLLANHDFELDLKLRKLLIKRGIYHIPIPCKQASVSYAHTTNDIERTIEATEGALNSL